MLCVKDSQMVIEQYKTGFPLPTDIPFEDLSVLNTSLTGTNTSMKTDTVRGTVSGRNKKRTGLRALFNPTKVITYLQLFRILQHMAFIHSFDPVS